MFGAIVQEWNVGGAGNRFPVKFHSGDSAGDACGVFYPEFVRSRMILKTNGIVWPGTGNARINAENRSSHPESEYPFHTRAIKPPCRTCVPGPTTAPNVRRFRIDISRQYIGLNLIALHTCTRTRAV